MSQHQARENPSPATESPWQDEPGYPHRIENHVKVYLHLEETPISPTVADASNAPVGTRVFRRTPEGELEFSIVTGWTSDGSAVFLEVDRGGTYSGPTFGSIYLAHDVQSNVPRWVVSPVTVDGLPLDGVDEGHYCDYEGHPPGERPDWDRQHTRASQVQLPTAAELLPLLADALGRPAKNLDELQLRDAGDLIAEHSAWRAERDELTAAESTGSPANASSWHNSDEAGRELADRAVVLLAVMTGQRSTTPPPSVTESGGVALMQAALSHPASLAASPAPDQTPRASTGLDR